MSSDEERFTTLLSNLQQGSMLAIKGEYPFTSDKPHFFVILNLNPTTDEYLVAVNNTSQIQTRMSYLMSQTTTDITATTVSIDAGEYSFFPNDTLFDCNEIHELTSSDLLSAYKRRNLWLPSAEVKLKQGHIEAIVKACQASRSVSAIQKKKINPTYNG